MSKNKDNSIKAHNNNSDSGVSRAAANSLRTTGEDPALEEKRPERVPVSGPRDVLTVTGKEAGYEYRWVNDTIPGRVQRFLDGYWEFCKHNLSVGVRNINSSESSDSVATLQTGGDTLYLMRIKTEYYNQDQEAKQRAINESEAAMFEEINNREGHYGSVTVSR